MTTSKILTLTEITQLQNERKTAFQDKSKNLKCSIRDKNGKVSSPNTNTGAIRVLLYGGAIKAGDNKGFKGAAENTLADYVNDSKDTLCCYLTMLTGGGEQIVDYIENQPKNSIQSLDIFTHGTTISLEMVLGSSTEQNATDITLSRIFQTHFQQLRHTSSDLSLNPPSKQYDIGDLDLDCFTNSCKIEIHGCSTGGEEDNFARSLSIALYKAGKKRSVVIAHPEKVSGNIIDAPFDENGNFDIPFFQYDYRHGKRILYHNGVILHTFTKKGRLTATDINQYLNKVTSK